MVKDRIAERATLYVSDKDRALVSSGIIHSNNRAGFTPPLTIVPNIDTIEVSDVDLTLLGHGYVAECRGVLTDMGILIRTNERPATRQFLDTANTPDGQYWIIK
jgi:hypothetical protein